MNQRRIVASGQTFCGVAEIEAQEYRTFFYKLRFCRCRGCVAELHRETTDYYTTSFSDSRKIQSHGIFPQNVLRAARGREYALYNT